ncbi:MAG: cryptic plasmid protein A [Lysobacteraceae bacterium]
MGVVVESKRDERTLAWLIDQLDEGAVTAACRRLAGQRRANVSNIAKVLGVVPPKVLAITPAPEARDHIRRILALLGDKT